MLTTNLFEGASTPLAKDWTFFYQTNYLEIISYEMDQQKAVEYFLQPDQQKPANCEEWMLLVSVYGFRRKMVEALACAIKGTQCYTYTFEPLVLLARVYTDRGEYALALSTYENMLKALAEKSGKPLSDIHLYDEVEGDIIRLCLHLQEVEKCRYYIEVFDFAFPVTLQEQGIMTEILSGFCSGALGLWETYETNASGMPDYWIDVGDKFKDKGEYAAALLLYEDLLRYEPGHYGAWNRMGVVYADNLQQNEEAIICYQKAIACKGDFYHAYCNLAVAYSNMGITQKAERLFKMVISCAPDLDNAYFNLGYLYQYDYHDYDKAALMLEKGLELWPENRTARHHLTLIYLKQKRANKAYPLVIGLLEEYPDKKVYQFFWEKLCELKGFKELGMA